jgi:2-polyprenyl-3-methyl-5-hydroxy-6-metoxy-1,4-benzoquinol methylase
VVEQVSRGYGGALAEGFAAAGGEYLLTMDADFSHTPIFIRTLWAAHESADVLIASRYVRGGRSVMPPFRYVMSRVLNTVFPRILSLKVRDMSSGFRLYHRKAVEGTVITGQNFDALQELLLRAYAGGWRIREVPFAYQPRDAGRSKASLIKFGRSYTGTLKRMWLLRNSVECADYDDRAFDSVIPLQRYWQRRRHNIVLSMAQNYVGTRMLDVGCGSSRILLDLPGAIGLDVQHHKLRYMSGYGTSPLITGSVFALPFRDGEFDCVICSEVIEHLPAEPSPIAELLRVLRPHGALILGTPDYGGRAWPTIERAYGFFAPNAYADEHITHYTRESMVEALAREGWHCTSLRFICRAEMIGLFIRRDTPDGSVVPDDTTQHSDGAVVASPTT